MIPLNSSVIARAGYDVVRRTLRLEYRNGRVYEYSAVPLEVYKALLAAESTGAYVNGEIKPHYDCIEVD